MFKSGFITIIGRPNVGKSTLTNRIMGEKLSIVSCKPQTTRNNINTILTEEDFQLIFVDTPGIHKPKDKLGDYMVKSAEDSIKDVDLVIFLTTPQDGIGREDRYILENIKTTKIPVFLVLNKIDENPASRVAKTLKNYSEFFDFQEIIPVSALKKKNTDELLELMVKYMPEGPKYYPEDVITDRQEKFIVSEIIREKSLRLLSKEVPHGIAVEIIFMRKDPKGIYNIEANIICEKESHKGIIIGKNGSMLKRISSYAREDIEKFLNSRVYLQVWVKVRKEWRDNDRLLKELGYKK
ncbi:GTPase Era [Clostridium sp. WLY-B-L2]|jgi:GTP-binding protein Era|uniref:GTPase Era n=1 Tax=Clostridium aromativorans TaxID=2836848 RepID=A0ABS8N688_9CLOT|nr:MULTISPECIES: GTPase Era [Clostridium]KAA8672927.1 GTPase Era [Clostridium sp. HV4-5-A1G]MCC9294228.1 GTPase Era [Clostridium aromativorans]CAB1240614.1 maturation of 16S RNA and assembly of 30S ribosomal subunit GTPase [Clostridiaceae bacterium BL-3]